MTSQQITDKLMRLRYEGKWSIGAIAKASSLSHSTIANAYRGQMSQLTQTRLTAVLRSFPSHAPVKVPKKKYGHAKLYLLRYKNLSRWIGEIELRTGLKKFKRKSYFVTKENGGYVCAKLDYMMKSYLLELFKKELATGKVFLGDAYPAEAWVKKLHEAFPNTRRELCMSLMKR